MRRIRRLLLLLLCLSICMTPCIPVFAADSRVVFTVSEPDVNNLVTVNVTAYDTVFEGFQFALSYDLAKVVPVSWSSGEVTANALQCIQKEAVLGDLALFANISKEQSKMVVLGYSENDPEFSVSAETSGAKLMTLRFKVSGDGAASLRLSENAKNNALTYEYRTLPVNFIFETPFTAKESKDNSSSNGSSAPTPDISMKERLKNTIVLQIGNYAAAKDGVLCHIYDGEKQITPYIKTDAAGNGRTMVPVRFIAEKLGAQVDYEDRTKTVTVAHDGIVIKMNIDSSTYTVNGETKTMDSAAELKALGYGSGNARTMVPMRFVAEALGKSVYWDDTNKLIVISEQDMPWKPERLAEKQMTGDVLVIFSPLMRDLI